MAKPGIDRNQLALPELEHSFSGYKSVTKAQLRNFYRELTPDLTEQGFRRMMYALEKRRVIISVASGVYVFPDWPGANLQKEKFIPFLSPEILAIHTLIQETFPYLTYVLWETRILHDFMTHQPGQNQLIVEVEKEAAESVFHALSHRYPQQVFLQPDRNTLERYILPAPQSIIVSNLISQAPVFRVQNVPYSSIEKILVDILVDNKKYFIFQGQELVNIFENVFREFWVNEKALFRYARRRKPVETVKDFIRHQTHVELIEEGGNES